MTNKDASIIIGNIPIKGDDCYTIAEYQEAKARAIQALEQQPCEDTEVIKVSKGAVKARQGRFVIYDIFWLKENFYTTEEKIYGQPKQPCEDCISREAVIDHICEDKECYKEECKGRTLKRCIDLQWVFDLPSVKPKYTDEEIDRAQAVEQAYVDKMVELAVEESRKKWLNSFDTNSATKCFEAVNLLKQRLEGER